MSYLLDSNIIIYLKVAEYRETLENFLEGQSIYASQVSIAEVLGFTEITEDDSTFFNSFFDRTQLLTVDRTFIQEATRLRQYRKLSLGDAIVAATASIHQLTLVTANTKDFKKLQDAIDPSLDLINPLEV